MDDSISISMGDATRPWRTLLASHSDSLRIKAIQMTTPCLQHGMRGITYNAAQLRKEIDGAFAKGQSERLSDEAAPTEHWVSKNSTNVDVQRNTESVLPFLPTHCNRYRR